MLSLFISFSLGVSTWLTAVIGLLGLLASWEFAGRVASSYLDIHDDRLAQDRVLRTLAFFAALAVSLAYFIVALRLTAESFPDRETFPIALVFAATLIGIWLVFRMVRQGWRTSFATFGLLAITGVGAFVVVDNFSAPEPSSIGMSLLRLLAVWLIAAGFLLTQSRWSTGLWRRAAWLVPVQVLSLAYVLRPPGSLNGAWDAGLWWMAMGIFGVLSATMLGLGVLGLWKDAVQLRRLVFSADASRPSLPTPSLIAALFLPAIAMAPLSGWMQWSLAAAFSTLGAGTACWLMRRGKRADPNRPIQAQRDGISKDRPVQAPGAPPKILTLTAV
jgi:MFS family permease